MTTPSSSGPVTKREILGWALFDVANSAYTTVVITIVFSAFFVNHLVPVDSGWGNSLWAIAMALSNALAMILAPVLGTVCDLVGKKKRFLLVNTWVCALATAMLYWVGPGDIALAIGLIVISNTAWMLTEVFCASFLTDITTKENIGFVSGLGWGLGYLGGLVSLVLVLFGVITADSASDPSLYIEQNQQAMVVVGLYFLVVCLPTFWWLKDRTAPQGSVGSLAQVVSLTRARLGQCWSLCRELPVLTQFFAVFTLYSAGMAIVIKFFGIYLDGELAMSASEKTTMFLALQLSAFAGALGFGWAERHIGPKATLTLTLLWWVAGVVSIYLLDSLALWLGSTPNEVFFWCAMLAGSALGSTQSASRTLVGLLTPRVHSGMMFGFWGLFSRLAAILGSLAFALVADLFSLHQALLVILAFFALGVLLVLIVPISRGIDQADRYRL